MNDSLLSKLRSYDKQYASLGQIPAPKRGGESTYLYVHEKCQVMLYAENGHYKRVMAVSTGKAGKRTETPNVTKRLGYTNRGWSCSTLWPESCRTHTEGRFANISDYGNMYNKRGVIGNILVHGSTFVPTYPDSHGCIRVTVKDADWMYDHVGNGQKPLIIITGAY